MAEAAASKAISVIMGTSKQIGQTAVLTVSALEINLIRENYAKLK